MAKVPIPRSRPPQDVIDLQQFLEEMAAEHEGKIPPNMVQGGYVALPQGTDENWWDDTLGMPKIDPDMVFGRSMSKPYPESRVPAPVTPEIVPRVGPIPKAKPGMPFKGNDQALAELQGLVAPPGSPMQQEAMMREFLGQVLPPRYQILPEEEPPATFAERFTGHVPNELDDDE